ncbi:hypothetical protein RM52_00615 [Microbacterium hominis]|uniref:Uncharacterized protein n=1 Tax=Microbacterium hominis TaxID=162426 RepID=A0A0B4CU32_9MICO|nr:hypothetical protein RM52_00615 [Microbacterium hominis]
MSAAMTKVTQVGGRVRLALKNNESLTVTVVAWDDAGIAFTFQEQKSFVPWSHVSFLTALND